MYIYIYTGFPSSFLASAKRPKKNSLASEKFSGSGLSAFLLLLVRLFAVPRPKKNFPTPHKFLSFLLWGWPFSDWNQTLWLPKSFSDPIQTCNKPIEGYLVELTNSQIWIKLNNHESKSSLGRISTQTKTFSQLGLWKNFPQAEKFLFLKIWWKYCNCHEIC